MNTKYKTSKLKYFFRKIYNKYHKKFVFESKNIVKYFESQYVGMIVPKKLKASELNGLECTLAKFE